MSQVNSFREVVGPDGEITYEFCSDAGGSSESSEDEDYVPPTARLARRNAIPNLDTATEWAESLPTNQNPPTPTSPQTGSVSGSGSGDEASNDSVVIELSDGSEAGQGDGPEPGQGQQVSASIMDIALDPGGSNLNINILPVPGPSSSGTTPGSFVSRRALEMLARSQREEMDDDEEDEDQENMHMPTLMTSWFDDSDGSDTSYSVPTPVAPKRQTGRRGRPRKTRKKGRSKKKAKIIAQPRVIAPPKELPPATIYVDVERLGRIADYKRQFRGLKVFVPPPPPIPDADIMVLPSSSFVSASDSKQTLKYEKVKAYKIGEIEMSLKIPNSIFGPGSDLRISSFDSKTIWNEFPGLTSIQFSVSSSKVLLLKQEKHLSSEESAHLIPPKGKAQQYKNRKLNYVHVEHYYFPFDLSGTVSVETLNGLRNVSLRIDLVSYDTDSSRLLLNVMLLESAIMGVHNVDSIPAALPSVKKNLLSYFFGVDPVLKIEPQEKEDIEWFYGQVQKYHKNQSLPSATFPLQHPSMKPTLRDYQKNAVSWMLYKEGALGSTSTSSRASIDDAFLSKMSIPIELSDPDEPEDSFQYRKPAFYNPYAGYVSWSRPEIPKVPSGGILADEMGLGKTVEVLALILLHPCPDLKEEMFEDDIDDEDEKVRDPSEFDSHNSEAEPNSEAAFNSDSESDPEFCPIKASRKSKKSKPLKPVDSDDSESDSVSDSDSVSGSASDEEFVPVSVGKNKRKGPPVRSKNQNHCAKKARKNKKQSAAAASSKSALKSKPKPKTKSLKRPISPCEFQAHNFDVGSEIPDDNVEVEDENNQGERQVTLTRRSKRSVVKSFEYSSENEFPAEPVPVAGPSPAKKSKRRKSSSDGNSGNNTNEQETGPKKEKLYDKVKVLYDAALSSYKASAVVEPKFHGTFFDTYIKAKARFECICGDGMADRRKTVSCTHCLSSQHAECVGFDLRGKRSLKTYLCPHCQFAAPPVRSKATLIVTPATISHQWIKEIQRHVKNKHLNILFYKGVNKHGYISPHKLAEYDLVITTYTVLSADLNHANLSHTNSEKGMKFRSAKKYMTIPSSLKTVLWWRVCLDEAQMVEGVGTKMAEMATQIQGVHRWCVTGTPLNKGLQDLYGLVSFLGISPVCQEFWWEYLIRVPFYKKDTSLLFEFFGQFIWRTGKPSVLNQLGIPPQVEIFHWLQFSPVEAHFYKRQYEICSSKIIAKIARLKQLHGDSILQTRLSSLDRQTLHSVLHPFLELRQACCHPQMVRGNVLNLQKLKETVSMEELLTQLIKKTIFQCADDHRLIIAALNGLAGLFIISSRWAEASEKYREVLQRSEKYADKFKTDSLQLLHAFENLADLLDGNYPGVGYTLADDRLRPQAEEIRQKYLQKYALAVKAAKDTVDPVTEAVVTLMENFRCTNESWWFNALRRAIIVKKDEDLVNRIKDDLLYKAKIFKKKATNSIANKFSDSNGLQRILIEKIQELEELRDSMLGSLDELINKDTSSFVEPAVHCHLRGQSNSYYNDKKNVGFRCQLCENHDQFIEYEALIFSTVENEKISRVGRNRQVNNFAGEGSSELTQEEKAMILLREEEELLETTEHVNVNMLLDQRRQTWADSDTEKILKTILSFAKLNGCSVAVIDDGTNHVKLFETMKKEFRLLRILWRQVFDEVSAIDELSQATTRLRIQDPNEVLPDERKKPHKATLKALSSGITEKADKIMNIHVLSRGEVDLKIEQIEGDYAMGKDSLAVHMGQVLYLETLNKNGYGKKGAFNHDDCPICANRLGHQWCVLNCGHSFCADCIKQMCSRNTTQTILCPLCRAMTKVTTISFIDTRIEEESTSAAVAGPSTSSASCLPPTAPVEVKGSHSTKVEAIVETLLRLQESHRGEKVLIFSTWTDVLEIIARALIENDIPYCDLMSSAKNKFHETIERFKNREDIQALLIPLQSGSKGLNLIEATHVLLVEPIFNLASELQAIGRVHRIGQTKSTYVHRFYIRKTIEEQLFEILKTHDVSSDDEGFLTLSDLQKLISSGSGTGYILGSGMVGSSKASDRAENGSCPSSGQATSQGQGLSQPKEEPTVETVILD